MFFDEKFISLEEDTSGLFVKEIEHVFYARITDFKQLNSCDSKVRMEQWEIKLPMTHENAAKGSIRVRSIKEENKPVEYVLTSKISINESGDKLEASVPSTAEQFVQFKFLADVGMIKDRYTFNLENGLKWEIDVFIDQDGGYYQWCKIDFEVPNHETKVPSFPIDFLDVVKGSELERGSAEDKQVQKLYDNYFLTKNMYKKSPQVQMDREISKDTENKVQDEVIMD